MPYIRRTTTPALDPEAVDAMARAMGLAVPTEDLGSLAVELADQLASVAALDRLDLSGVDPGASFDPRWPEQPSALHSS